MDFEKIARGLPWMTGVTLLRCDANGLLAIEKPAGLMSHPNKASDAGKSLLSGDYDLERQYFCTVDPSSGQERRVYLLNRLDSATSGIVLLSLDEGVAKSALESFEKKAVSKTYCALVFGALRGGSPLWRDRLAVKRAEGGVRAVIGGGAQAETKLVKSEPLPGAPMMSRLTLVPLTGRTHQLRIQCAKRHIPIVGDRTYGDFQKNKLVAKARQLKRLCLHCVGTELSYTVGGRSFQFTAISKAPF